jgi:hypothetical protein
MDLACLWNLQTADLFFNFFQLKKKKTKVGQPQEFDMGLVEKPDQYRYWETEKHILFLF